MSAYRMGLDALGAEEPVKPIPVVVDSKVRLDTPWWHGGAIIVGALASVVTLLKVITRKETR